MHVKGLAKYYLIKIENVSKSVVKTEIAATSLSLPSHFMLLVSLPFIFKHDKIDDKKVTANAI